MDTVSTWYNDFKNYSSTNNFIIKTIKPKHNRNLIIEHYLVSKDENELYFYDCIDVFSYDSFVLDSDLTFQIIDEDDNVISEIKKEKYFLLDHEELIENLGSHQHAIIKLPLPRPINLDQFKKMHNNSKIVLEAEIKEAAIRQVKEKNTEAIQYDANEAYNNIHEFDLERD